jgi:hypothetical protein
MLLVAPANVCTTASELLVVSVSPGIVRVAYFTPSIDISRVDSRLSFPGITSIRSVIAAAKKNYRLGYV